MSIIQTQVLLADNTSQLQTSGPSRYTPDSPAFNAASIEVLAVDESPALGDVITPRYAFVRLLSGDDLFVGLASGTYPFRLTVPSLGAGESMLLRMDVEGLREISSITCGADTAGSLSGDYLDLTDRAGTVRVWFDVDDGSTPPATPGGGRLIEVDITEDDTADAVAIALHAALNSDAEFSAIVSSAVVLATDKHTGTRADVSAGTTGWTVANVQQGAASPVLHLKSTGTSQVLVAYSSN